MINLIDFTVHKVKLACAIFMPKLVLNNQNDWPMRMQLQLICISFGNQNDCVPKCEHREINLIILVHRDSEGK